jgi:hypothetical protein
VDSMINFDHERKFLNKWEMHKWLQSNDISPGYLPDTIFYADFSNIEEMLNRYGRVYIKSVASFGGKEVIYLSRREDKNDYILKKEQHPIQVADSIDSMVLPLSESEKYIVQQGIIFKKYKNRPICIRSHLIKHPKRGWVYIGDLVRAGGEGAVVSNVTISGGEVLPTSYIFENYDNYLKYKLYMVSQKICQSLNEIYEFKEVGIDFGIDEKGDIWIIEVNTNDAIGGPCHLLFSKLPDWTIYNKLRKMKAEIAGLPDIIMNWLFTDENQ